MIQKKYKQALSRLSTSLMRARAEKGETLEKVASKTGLSRPSVDLIELGDRNPTLCTLMALADYYGMSIDELMQHKPGEKYGT